MKQTLFFCSVLALAASKPGGYYHQEYNYKTSSSSFKNNELQHKNENEGFYSKDGDLDGVVKPKVKSHSQQSEYINPKLLSGSSNYREGYSGGSNGNYLASSDRLFANPLSAHQGSSSVDGYASSDRVLGLSNVYSSGGHGAYQQNENLGAYRGTHGNYDSGSSQGGSYGSSFGGSSSYGYSHGSSSRYGYGGNTHEAIGGYSTHSDLTNLLQTLQNDMSRQLEGAINKQYKSSGYSTSVSSSQMSADVRLLEDELKRNLTRQLEDSLRTQYGQQELIGSNSYSISGGRPSATINYNNQELAELRRQVEDNLIKKLHQDMRTTYNTESRSSYSSSNTYDSSTSRSIYVPSSNVYDSRLRPQYYETPILVRPSNIQYRYTPVANPESITQIASRTQSNINVHLDNALHSIYSKYFGSDRSYYTLSDFDNEVNRLKDDIIRNLTIGIDDQLRTNYGQQVLKGGYYYSVSTDGNTSPQYNYNVRDLEDLKRQVEENLVKKLDQTVNTYRQQYQTQQSYSVNSNYLTATTRPAYYTSGGQTYDYSELQRQLSQQLQNALSRHDYGSYSSSSSSYNPQAFQTSFDELSRELQRNLTEQLNNFRAHSSSSSSYGYSSGSSGGSANFESMKNQLQDQLMKQLQQGLQKQYQYSASASYSASSSSSSNSNYGSRPSYPTHSNYMECCGSRKKRDISYNAFDDSLEIPQETEDQNTINQIPEQDQQLIGQTEDDLNQQLELENPNAQRFTQQELTGQQLDDDFTQQLLLSNEHKQRKVHSEEQQLTQQLEDDFQPLQLSGQHKQEKLRNDDQQLTQQLEDDFQPLQLSGQHKPQKLNSDNQQLTQQLEDDFQQLKLSDGQQKLRSDDQQLTQQLEDDFTQQLQSTDEQKQQKLEGQQFTQQLEDDSAQKLQLSSEQKTQKVENVDQQLTQQSDDFTQQLELTNLSPNNEQQLEDLSQKLEITNNKVQEERDSLQQQELEIPKPKKAYILERDQKPVLPNLEVDEISNLEQEKLNNQEKVKDLDQKLELTKPKLEYQHSGQVDQNQEELTQQLELENVSKLGKHTDESQQLELSSANDIEQNSVQQQLELENIQKPKKQRVVEDSAQQLELESVQKQEQIDQDQQLIQQLETFPENKPQQTQDIDQQLELSNTQNKKRFPENQEPLAQQIQDNDLSQQLELEGPKPNKKLQTESKSQEQELENSVQQLELSDDKKPKIEMECNQEETTLKLEQIIPQKIESIHQEIVDQKIDDSKIEKKNEDSDAGQKLENENSLTQQLELDDAIKKIREQELDGSSYTKTQYSREEQQLEGNLDQQLILTHDLKNENVGQQLENDFEQTAFGGAHQHHYYHNIKNVDVNPQSELPGSTHIYQHHHNPQFYQGIPGLHIPPVQTKPFPSNFGGDFERHYTLVNHPSMHTYQIYGPSSYNQHTQSGERSFTNAHSGFYSQNELTERENYQKALKQQDALLDFLKQKTQATNQVSYGQRSVKKTVYVNGVPVSSTESRQYMKPNGEIIESGDLNTFPQNPNVFSHGQKTFGESFNYAGESQIPHGFYGNNIQNLQVSGQSTKRVVHFVNGKPVSASEKIQVLKPDGQIVESNHNLPLNGNLMNSYTHGLSSSHYAQNFNGFQPLNPNAIHNSQISTFEQEISSDNHRNGLKTKQRKGY